MNQTSQEKRAIVHRGIGRVAFLAHLDAIRNGVEEGWPLTALYEKHQGELVITYSQFARYVARYITKAVHATPTQRIEKPHPSTLPESAAKSRPLAEGAGAKATSPSASAEPARFVFDPNSPDRDALV